MKKITAFLAAAAAALSLSSCDKELREDIPSSDNITVDITVGDFDGVETKAVKSGWKPGDKLNIWFDGAYWKQLPQLVLTYDGSKWNESKIDAGILKSTGKFIVIYEASNSEFSTARNNVAYYFPSGKVRETGTTNFNTYHAAPLSCYQCGLDYTFSDGVLKATISKWKFATRLQVVITGLPKSASSYALKIDGVYNSACYYFNSVDQINFHAGSSIGGYSIGVENEDGVAFYFGYNTKPEARDVVFTLKELTSDSEMVLTKSDYELETSWYSLKAVKINAAKFGGKINGHEYVQIGSKKWATMNLGATTVAGSPATCFGDYYAWGETEPRYTGINYYGDNTFSFSGFKSEYPSGYAAPSTTIDGTTLDASHDAAKQAWGATWRIPTEYDFCDLYYSCGGKGNSSSNILPDGDASTTAKGIYWCSDYNGVKGVLFSDGINQLFIPVSGYVNSKSFYYVGKGAYYWSSSLYTNDSYLFNAYYMNLGVAIVSPMANRPRYNGLTIRPVSD
ncbi:MAG: hypothetical protein KBT08_00690 [Bacteroidales bacterium]|nr:hypothetical protein [Candidatus Cryptobacteroides onthequi]